MSGRQGDDEPRIYRCAKVEDQGRLIDIIFSAGEAKNSVLNVGLLL